MKLGKRRTCLLILALSVVACAVVLVITKRRSLTVVEFANYTGMTMKGIILSCDGIKAPPRELASGESIWFKIDESKAKDVRVHYLDVDGHSESFTLTNLLNPVNDSKDVTRVIVGRGKSVATMSGIQFTNRWENFKYQSRIWFHRTF